jgi:hypothetical protein
VPASIGYRQRFCIPVHTLTLAAHSATKKPLHPGQKEWNGHQHPALSLLDFAWMVVSPFDGANRIRFKGSPALSIFNCQLPIVL